MVTINTLLQGWVNRFGIMPKLPYEEADLKEITAWMWSYFKFGNGSGRGQGKGRGKY